MLGVLQWVVWERPVFPFPPPEALVTGNLLHVLSCYGQARGVGGWQLLDPGGEGSKGPKGCGWPLCAHLLVRST